MNPKDENLRNKKDEMNDDFDDEIIIGKNKKIISDSDDELNSMGGLGSDNIDDVKKILIKAQQETEEIYISWEETKEIIEIIDNRE